MYLPRSQCNFTVTGIGTKVSIGIDISTRRIHSREVRLAGRLQERGDGGGHVHVRRLLDLVAVELPVVETEVDVELLVHAVKDVRGVILWRRFEKGALPLGGGGYPLDL